jgi:hypothetical protein
MIDSSSDSSSPTSSLSYSSSFEPTAASLSNIIITPEDVNDAIDKQAAASAAGPDGIPAILIKKCKSALNPVLLSLFQHSMTTGQVPQLFRSAFVKPLLKSGNLKSDKTGFRPIALTSILCRTMERIIRIRIQNHLEDEGLLTEDQHGFRSGRSCLTQLLQHYDQVLSALEAGGNLDVVYLDYAKAFDKVDLNILARRLKSKGITGQIGQWIDNWLKGRIQQVLVDENISNPSPVTSGVPQG